MQTSNEDAIRFYQRAGFEVGGTVENYYKRLDPPHAVLLRKVMHGSGGGEHSPEHACGGGDSGDSGGGGVG